MGVALKRGLYVHVEGMRLGHHAVAAQKILLRRKAEQVLLAVQAAQFDRQLHRVRGHRLALARHPGTVFRRHAGFEDCQLDDEVAVGQQAAVVRTFGCFLCRGGAVFGLRGVRTGVGGRFGLATGGERQAQQGDQGPGMQ